MLSTTSEYALSAVAALARLPEGEAMLARELAREVQVPPNYLSKVLSTLSKAGILVGSRGAGGGYRLARSAGDIHLIDIVEVFEGDRARPACLLGGGRECSDQNACPAHESWKKVKEAYVAFLETKTIEDIRGTLGRDSTFPPVPATQRTGTKRRR
jgi:Rrf2 family protein